MRIRNLIGENGKSVLEYIPETDADRDEIDQMQLDGDIPDTASQSHPGVTEPEQEAEE